MKPLISLLLASFLPLLVHAADKPNVVVLLADDLGYQDIGCYGGPVKTPALDSLAAGGVRFTEFYSGCAVCSPSRATLITGRHHIRTGVYSWIHDPSQRSHLLERETTLAELLKGNGYATAHVGKWHLGLPGKKYDKPAPDKHGFDYWFATWNNAEPSHRNPKTFIRNGKPVGPLEGYSCQLVVDEAINWLDQRDDKKQPFFLNVWFHEPHAPIAAPEDVVKTYGALKDRAAIYSGTIDNTDRAIARLLKKLEQVAPKEDTLIIYASDNGSYLQDRVGNLKGKKGTNWEGGIRVPGIFNWPGTIKSGAESDVPGGVVDVVPTICALLGFEPPKAHLDGSNLAPILTGKGEFNRHQPLYWHLQKSRPIVAIRDGDYSLVADPAYDISKNNMFQEAWIPKVKAGGYTNYRLYNLKKDPSQANDLANSMPELTNKLKTKLLAINKSIMADGHDWHIEK